MDPRAGPDTQLEKAVTPCAKFGEQYLCGYAGARGDVAGAGMSRIAKHGNGWPLWVLTPPRAGLSARPRQRRGGSPSRCTAGQVSMQQSVRRAQRSGAGESSWKAIRSAAYRGQCR